MDNFEEKIMRKVRPIKKNWFSSLIKQTMVREKKPKILGDKLKDKTIRDIWTLFETEEEKEERKKKHNGRIIKDRITRDTRTLWNNNYIEYESNGDKNRNLSSEEYLHNIKPYLRNIIINLQNYDA